jgi:hypothetical protein
MDVQGIIVMKYLRSTMLKAVTSCSKHLLDISEVTLLWTLFYVINLGLSSVAAEIYVQGYAYEK